MEKYLVIYSASANDNNIYNHVIGVYDDYDTAEANAIINMSNRQDPASYKQISEDGIWKRINHEFGGVEQFSIEKITF